MKPEFVAIKTGQRFSDVEFNRTLPFCFEMMYYIHRFKSDIENLWIQWFC